MNILDLKEKYILNKNDNLLPYGFFIWKSLGNSFINKLSSYGFSECYFFDEDSIENENKIQMLNYNTNNLLNHISYSKYDSLIEGAKTSSIDILQTYISLTKQVLGINLLVGKRVSFDSNEEYILGAYTNDNHFIEVGSVIVDTIENKVRTRYSSKILEALIEINYDEEGFIFSPLSSLYQIGIIPLRMNEKNVIPYARKLKQNMEMRGYRVLLDESKINDKDKLNDYKNKGIPLIIEVGPRDIMNSSIEVIKRTEGNILSIKEEKLDSYLNNFFKKINSDLINKQIKHILSDTIDLTNINDFDKEIEKGKIINIIWDGEEDTYREIERRANKSAIFMPFNQELFVSEDILSKRKGKYVLTICKTK